jgi:hypothetical protein
MKRNPGEHKKGRGEPRAGSDLIGPHRGTCPSGKVNFATRTDANRAATVQAERFGMRRPYHCQDCRWWHLTSQREHERPPLDARRQRPVPKP